MVQLTIDGKHIEVEEGTTVIKAAKQAGINIPALCGHPNLTPYGGCRLCVVEVEGMRTLQTACTLPVSNNMVVRTNTELLHESRNSFSVCYLANVITTACIVKLAVENV
jgi:NADH dehydrogenase/NADH:ubiquinone oxidoreductase subunit G